VESDNVIQITYNQEPSHWWCVLYMCCYGECMGCVCNALWWSSGVRAQG